MPRRLRNKVEVRQRDAERWALGIMHSTVAKKFIEGELGFCNTYSDKKSFAQKVTVR